MRIKDSFAVKADAKHSSRVTKSTDDIKFLYNKLMQNNLHFLNSWRLRVFVGLHDALLIVVAKRLYMGVYAWNDKNSMLSHY